jgi:hypothetical protein
MSTSRLPAELLKLCAEFGLSLEVSTYAVADER